VRKKTVPKVPKTIAGGGESQVPRWHKSLSPEQREAYAEWIVQRLSGWMHHEEMVQVLRRARQLADKENAPPAGVSVVEVPKRGRGKPGTWKSAWGIQMVREVEALIGPGKAEEEVIADLLSIWRRRFPDQSPRNLRRGYTTAAKWLAALDEHDE
jgi:hypothetical protein